MLHSVPQHLTLEFCHFLEINNEQQNTHAKLFVQVVMQSIDDAGHISWSSLMSVTSLVPEMRSRRVSGPFTSSSTKPGGICFTLWKEGSKETLQSRHKALRGAHVQCSQPDPTEMWLLPTAHVLTVSLRHRRAVTSSG